MDPFREQRFHASSPSQPLIGALLVHGLNGNKSDMAEIEKKKMRNYTDKYTYKRPFQCQPVHVYWLCEPERIYWSNR